LRKKRLFKGRISEVHTGVNSLSEAGVFG